MHFHGPRCFDFLCRIGNKQKLVWRMRGRSCDFLIALPFRLGSHACVKECRNVRSQITRIRIAKQELLRQDASGRINANSFSLPSPSFESCGHIGKYFTTQFSARKSLLPDSPLKRFQRCAFAVPRDQPLCIPNARTQPRFFGIVPPTRFKALAQIRIVLRTEILDQGLNFGILNVFLKKRFYFAAGKGEKRFIYKINGCRRTFNIQKNDADLRCVNRKHASYFAAACGGMYLGPQQTGS